MQQQPFNKQLPLWRGAAAAYCRNGGGTVSQALANFLRAVAEACSPQRFREENAVVRFISLS